MNTPIDNFEEEDTYNERGMPCPGGLYDAGGHPIPERWADYADYMHDMERDSWLSKSLLFV